MKTKIRLLLSMTLLGPLMGCATMTESPDVVVSTPTAMGAKWTVSGQARWEPDYALITVGINGTDVVSFEDQSFKLTSALGNYDGHPVQVVCPPADFGYQHPWCQVYLDGMHQATLNFPEQQPGQSF